MRTESSGTERIPNISRDKELGNKSRYIPHSSLNGMFKKGSEQSGHQRTQALYQYKMDGSRVISIWKWSKTHEMNLSRLCRIHDIHPEIAKILIPKDVMHIQTKQTGLSGAWITLMMQIPSVDNQITRLTCCK